MFSGLFKKVSGLFGYAEATPVEPPKQAEEPIRKVTKPVERAPKNKKKSGRKPPKKKL